MDCKSCGAKNKKGAKFCDSCGKSILSRDFEKVDVDIAKIQKNLKDTGNSVHAVGWLTIILNVGLYFWSKSDTGFSEYGLPASDLSSTFLMVVIASVYIILGNRIRQNSDKNVKLYLQTLLGISLLLLLWVLSSGGSLGLIFFILVAYLVSSLIKVNTAMKNQDYLDTLTDIQHKIDKKGWIIFAVISAILYFMFLSVDSTSTDLKSQTTTNSTTPAYSNSDLIKDTVRDLKLEMTLPTKIDESTTLVDITAQPSAIRYHYNLVGVNPNQISNQILKDNLVTGLCANSDTKGTLDMGINMEYSYSIVKTGQKYFVTLTKADCL